jgi:hypothetical protein
MPIKENHYIEFKSNFNKFFKDFAFKNKNKNT